MVFVAHASADVDAKSSYKAIIATCVVLSCASTAVVGVRLYLRRRSRCVAADDWMSFASLLFAVAYSILCIIRTCPAQFFAPTSLC